MSSAADRLRAQASTAAAKPSTKSAAGRAATADAAKRAAPFKATIRVEHAQNVALRRFLVDTAEALGVSRVSLQQATVALYDELLNDADLQARVIARATRDGNRD